MSRYDLQPAPGEQLVAGDAMAAGYQRRRVARQIRLFEIRIFSAGVQCCRRCTEVITSTRS